MSRCTLKILLNLCIVNATYGCRELCCWWRSSSPVNGYESAEGGNDRGRSGPDLPDPQADREDNPHEEPKIYMPALMPGDCYEYDPEPDPYYAIFEPDGTRTSPLKITDFPHCNRVICFDQLHHKVIPLRKEGQDLVEDTNSELQKKLASSFVSLAPLFSNPDIDNISSGLCISHRKVFLMLPQEAQISLEPSAPAKITLSKKSLPSTVYDKVDVVKNAGKFIAFQHNGTPILCIKDPGLRNFIFKREAEFLDSDGNPIEVSELFNGISPEKIQEGGFEFGKQVYGALNGKLVRCIKLSTSEEQVPRYFVLNRAISSSYHQEEGSKVPFLAGVSDDIMMVDYVANPQANQMLKDGNDIILNPGEILEIEQSLIDNPGFELDEKAKAQRDLNAQLGEKEVYVYDPDSDPALAIFTVQGNLKKTRKLSECGYNKRYVEIGDYKNLTVFKKDLEGNITIDTSDDVQLSNMLKVPDAFAVPQSRWIGEVSNGLNLVFDGQAGNKLLALGADAKVWVKVHKTDKACVSLHEKYFGQVGSLVDLYSWMLDQNDNRKCISFDNSGAPFLCLKGPKGLIFARAAKLVSNQTSVSIQVSDLFDGLIAKVDEKAVDFGKTTSGKYKGQSVRCIRLSSSDKMSSSDKKPVYYVLNKNLTPILAKDEPSILFDGFAALPSIQQQVRIVNIKGEEIKVTAETDCYPFISTDYKANCNNLTAVLWDKKCAHKPPIKFGEFQKELEKEGQKRWDQALVVHESKYVSICRFFNNDSTSFSWMNVQQFQMKDLNAIRGLVKDSYTPNVFIIMPENCDLSIVHNEGNTLAQVFIEDIDSYIKSVPKYTEDTGFGWIEAYELISNFALYADKKFIGKLENSNAGVCLYDSLINKILMIEIAGKGGGALKSKDIAFATITVKNSNFQKEELDLNIECHPASSAKELDQLIALQRPKITLREFMSHSEGEKTHALLVSKEQSYMIFAKSQKRLDGEALLYRQRSLQEFLEKTKSPILIALQPDDLQFSMTDSIHTLIENTCNFGCVPKYKDGAGYIATDQIEQYPDQMFLLAEVHLSEQFRVVMYHSNQILSLPVQMRQIEFAGSIRNTINIPIPHWFHVTRESSVLSEEDFKSENPCCGWAEIGRFGLIPYKRKLARVMVVGAKKERQGIESDPIITITYESYFLSNKPDTALFAQNEEEIAYLDYNWKQYVAMKEYYEECKKKSIEDLLDEPQIELKYGAETLSIGASTLVYELNGPNDTLDEFRAIFDYKLTCIKRLSNTIPLGDFIEKDQGRGVFWNPQTKCYMVINVDDGNFVAVDAKIHPVELSRVESYASVCIILPDDLECEILSDLDCKITSKIQLKDIPRWASFGSHTSKKCRNKRVLFISKLLDIRQCEIGIYDAESKGMFVFQLSECQIEVNGLECENGIQITQGQNKCQNPAFIVKLDGPRKIQVARVGEFGLVIHNRKLAKVMVMDVKNNSIDNKKKSGPKYILAFKPYFLNKDRENGALLATEESQIEYVECSQEEYDALAEFFREKGLDITKLLDQPA